MARSAPLSVLLVASFLLPGCWGKKPGQTPIRLPGPVFLTKDDVLSVNGRRLSLSGYGALRTELAGLPREAFLWVATAVLALQNELVLRGEQDPDPRTAVLLARYALQEVPLQAAEPVLRLFWGGQGVLPSPQEFRAHLDRLVSKSVVQRNSLVLAELH